MVARNLTWTLPCAALAIAAPLPAQAQESEQDLRTMVTIMRACAQIADIPARVQCYDNTVAGSTGEMGAPPASTPAAPRASGLGSEMLPQARAQQEERRETKVTARIAAAQRVAPGIYLVGLPDGAQWRFTESVPMSYSPPREGDEVEIESGALGSYRMRVGGQRAVRVMRVS